MARRELPPLPAAKGPLAGSTEKPVDGDAGSPASYASVDDTAVHGDVDWSVTEVIDWLPSLELSHLVPVFQANGVDGQELLSLTDADLMAMGVQSADDRRRLLEAVRILASRLRSEQEQRGDAADISLADISTPSVLPELDTAAPAAPRHVAEGDYSEAHEVLTPSRFAAGGAVDVDSEEEEEEEEDIDEADTRALSGDGLARPTLSSADGYVPPDVVVSDSTPTPSPTALAMLYSTVNKTRGHDQSRTDLNDAVDNTAAAGDLELVNGRQGEASSSTGDLQESRNVFHRLRDSFRRSSSGNSSGQSNRTDGSGPPKATDFIDPDSKAAGFVQLDEDSSTILEQLRECRDGAFVVLPDPDPTALQLWCQLHRVPTLTRLRATKQGLYVEGNQLPFESLSALVQYHKYHYLLSPRDVLFVLKYPFSSMPEFPVTVIEPRPTDEYSNAPWYFGQLGYEDACAVLQYEADGSFLVRERDSASPVPRGTWSSSSGPGPGAVCELVYVYQGRPHSKDVEMTRRGVRFRGGQSYFEDLGVLVLSYTASPGDELRCKLTHAPGQSPASAAAAAGGQPEDSAALDGFAFDVRSKQRRNRKSGPSMSLTEFAHGVEAEVEAASWFKTKPADVKAATLDLLERVDGAFYFRYGARLGQYVLTYVYQGHLQAELVAVLVDAAGSLGLGWTRARQAGHYASLRDVVDSALRPNSLLYCQLLLPELVGLREAPRRDEGTSILTGSVDAPNALPRYQIQPLEPRTPTLSRPPPAFFTPPASAPTTAASITVSDATEQPNGRPSVPPTASAATATNSSAAATSRPKSPPQTGRERLESPPRPGRMPDPASPPPSADRVGSQRHVDVAVGQQAVSAGRPRPILKHRESAVPRAATRHPFFSKKAASAPTGLGGTATGGAGAASPRSPLERGVIFASEVSHRTITPVSSESSAPASAPGRSPSPHADWAWAQLGRPRAVAVTALRNQSTGAFVIRNSESRPSCLALTYILGGALADELIIASRGRMDGPGVHLDSNPRRMYDSLAALLRTCATAASPLPCRLRMPPSCTPDAVQRVTVAAMEDGSSSHRPSATAHGGAATDHFRPPMRSSGSSSAAGAGGSSRSVGAAAGDLSRQRLVAAPHHLPSQPRSGPAHHVVPPRHVAGGAQPHTAGGAPRGPGFSQVRRRSAPQLVATMPFRPPPAASASSSRGTAETGLGHHPPRSGRATTRYSGAGAPSSETAVGSASQQSHFDDAAVRAPWCCLGQGFTHAMRRLNRSVNGAFVVRDVSANSAQRSAVAELCVAYMGEVYVAPIIDNYQGLRLGDDNVVFPSLSSLVRFYRQPTDLLPCPLRA